MPSPRSVTLSSPYSATEQTDLTLSGTGIAIGTAAGTLKLRIEASQGLMTAIAGSTGVTIQYDAGYPGIGFYVEFFGNSS